MTARDDTSGSDGSGDDQRTDGLTDRLDRRTLLKGSLLAGAVGAVGAGGYAVTDRFTGGGDGDWTPPDWEAAEPPLATPWFEDVSPENARPEYPRPQLTRDRWQTLNGVWEFETVTDERPESFEGSILVPFPVESALSGVQQTPNRLWYRRTFTVPEDWAVGDGERLHLHFEAVDYETTVSVNGETAGTHTGGYDHFAVDVTDHLTGGEEELVVEVYDRTGRGQARGKQRIDPRGIWYTSVSGIWQTVWMEPVPEAHVRSLDATPDVESESLRLTVDAPEDAGLTVEATASDDGGTVGSVTGAPGEELALSIADPTLWTPENPHLYDLTVRLLRDGEAVDEVESYFGMRSVGTDRVDGDVRLTLNDEFVFHLGTLDQGYWPDGIYTAPTDAAMQFDLQKHKELGFNTVRKHVKVEPRRWYYHADRLGLLVWQDMPSMSGTPAEPERQQFEEELHTVVDQLGNHPSIAVWTVFNEGWGIYDQERLTRSVAEQDPARLVEANSGINVNGGDCGCGDLADYHNYPGPGSAPPADERASVLGEFGGLGLVVEDHKWPTEEDFSYDAYPTSTALTDAYVAKIERTQLLMERCGLSAGVWTQITDVEREINGLYTYDREQVKVDPERVRAANEALLSASASADPPTPDEGGSGLSGVTHWPLDAGEGDTAVDASGDRDATLVGDPTWTEGRDGAALAFEGESSLDAGTAVLDTLGDYSVAAWVKPASLEGFQTAVSQDGEAVSAFYLQYVPTADRFALSALGQDAPGAAVRALAESAPETGRWYHLVGVRDHVDRALRLYVDGERVGEAPYCPGFATDGSTVVGRAKYEGAPVDFWNGAIDDVRLYERALDDGEVADLYRGY